MHNVDRTKTKYECQRTIHTCWMFKLDSLSWLKPFLNFVLVTSYCWELGILTITVLFDWLETRSWKINEIKYVIRPLNACLLSYQGELLWASFVVKVKVLPLMNQCALSGCNVIGWLEHSYRCRQVSWHCASLLNVFLFLSGRHYVLTCEHYGGKTRLYLCEGWKTWLWKTSGGCACVLDVNIVLSSYITEFILQYCVCVWGVMLQIQVLNCIASLY